MPDTVLGEFPTADTLVTCVRSAHATLLAGVVPVNAEAPNNGFKPTVPPPLAPAARRLNLGVRPSLEEEARCLDSSRFP